MLTLSVALLLSTAPQAKLLMVHPFEPQGTTAAVVATARDAVLAELKAQGYDARAAELGPPKGKVDGGAVSGDVLALGGTFSVSLRLRALGSNQILAATTVRCGSLEKLAEAAKEAAAQLAKEGREKWGVRTKFKPK